MRFSLSVCDFQALLEEKKYVFFKSFAERYFALKRHLFFICVLSLFIFSLFSVLVTLFL